MSMGVGAFALRESSVAEAAPTTVSVPDDQPTIQAAVDAVADGGTVEISPGTYHESVRIGKPVTIVGDPGDTGAGPGPNAPVLDGGGATRTAGIHLHHDGQDPDDVTIRGLVLRNYGERPDGGEWGHGVAAGRDNNGITVADCRVEDVGAAGVSVSGPGANHYRDWTVERCQFVGAPLAGVRFDHVSEAVIADNEFVAPTGYHDYPRFGVYVHTNTDRGNSSTQEQVTIEGNRFEGNSERAAVWLLSINKNDPDTDTRAELRDVTIVENEFHDMPDSAAVAAAANPVRGATTRLRNLTVARNTVRNAKWGLTVDSGAADGVANVMVSDNDIRESEFGVEVSGRAPAALSGVTLRKNAVDTDVLGVMVANHERDGDESDERYAVDDVEIVGGEYRGGSEWGIAVNAHEPRGVGSVTVDDVVAVGKEGLHAVGHAPGAVESVTVSGGRFESIEGAGVHVGGNTDTEGDSPALGSATLDDIDVDGQGPGVAVTADGPDALGSANISGGRANGLAGVFVRAHGAGALEQLEVTGTTLDATEAGFALRGTGGDPNAPSVGQTTLDGVAVESGQGFFVAGGAPDSIGQVTGTNITSHGTAGMRVIGHAAGAIHGVDIEGLQVVDASEGPGLEVAGRKHDDTSHDGDRPHVGPVHVTGADLAARHHAIMVNGDVEGAALSLDIVDATVRSDEGGGVVVHGDAVDSVDAVDVSGVMVERARWNGLRVHGTAPGAVDRVTVNDFTTETARAPGVQIVGEHPETEAATAAIGTVDVDGFDVTTEPTPETEDGHDGVVVRGQDEATVGSVSLRNGTIDADFIGVSAAAERNGEIDDLSLASLDISSGAAGVEVAAHSDATLSTATLTELAIQPGWAGVQVHGKEGGRVRDVAATGLDVTADEGPGLLVDGKQVGSVGTVAFEDSRFRSPVFLSNRVRAEASGGVESVSFHGCDLSESHTGLFVWGKTADAVESVAIAESEVRDNNYGVIVAGPEESPQRGDAVNIRQTNIVGNSFQHEGDTRGYGVLNIGDGVVDARHNYWGSPSGPAYPRPGKNPRTAPNGETPEAVLENYPRRADFAGNGDRVSEGVRYEPYLKQPV